MDNTWQGTYILKFKKKMLSGTLSESQQFDSVGADQI